MFSPSIAVLFKTAIKSDRKSDSTSAKKQVYLVAVVIEMAPTNGYFRDKHFHNLKMPATFQQATHEVTVTSTSPSKK